jgi:hypothetical protein
MSAKFVVSHLDQQLGPYDELTLKTKWQEGEFLPIDYVFDEEKQDWVLISDRFEWAKKPAQVSPPPIKAEQPKKKTIPPPAPKEAIVAAATSPSIHLSQVSLSQITVPTLNVPVPVEVETPDAIELTSAGVERTKIEIIPEPVEVRSAPASAATASNGQLKMVNGVAVVDLSTLTPGQLELKLNNAGQEIKLNLQVRSAEPARIDWSVKPMQPVAGTDCEVTCRANDKHGHLCTEFKGAFAIKAGDKEYAFEIEKGLGTVKFQQTKAEPCEVRLLNRTDRQLELPNAFKVDWQPGPAVRLVLEGSPELVAGSSAKVEVKAVDQYGNLANTFTGTLNLEVKAG